MSVERMNREYADIIALKIRSSVVHLYTITGRLPVHAATRRPTRYFIFSSLEFSIGLLEQLSNR